MATAKKTEVWKPVADWEGIYEVSNLGNVKSLERVITLKNGKKRTVPEKILKPRKTPKGYWQVCLYRDGKGHWVLVHRLVAEAFCPKPEGCNIANHWDSNKDRNEADNLEWTTPKGNVRHAIDHGRRVGRAVQSSSGRYYPIMKMAEADGFSAPEICRVCRGQRKTHRGETWRYAEDGGGPADVSRRFNP